MGNCRLFEPLIADAARQRADLVVLPETLTFFGLGKSFFDVAETVPGPSTDYFGELAKKSNTIVLPANVADVGSMIAMAMKFVAKDRAQ